MFAIRSGLILRKTRRRCVGAAHPTSSWALTKCALDCTISRQKTSVPMQKTGPTCVANGGAPPQIPYMVNMDVNVRDRTSNTNLASRWQNGQRAMPCGGAQLHAQSLHMGRVVCTQTMRNPGGNP